MRASDPRIARCHGAADTVWLPTSKVKPATRRPTCRQWATSAAASSGRTPKLGESVALRGERQPDEHGDLGQAAELRDLRGAVDDEGADAAEVRSRDVGDRRHGVVVQAARDRDAGALEEVDLAARGDGEARAERVDRADRGGVGERPGREVDGDVGKLVAQGEQLRGHPVGVEHEQRAAVPPHQAVEIDAVGVVGEVATNEFAVRCTIGGRCGSRVVHQPRRDAARTFDEDIGEMHRSGTRASDAGGIAAQHDSSVPEACGGGIHGCTEPGAGRH